MKYKTILSDELSIFLLMKKLSLLAEVVEVRKINHHPDYDFSEYRGPVTQTYFFKDEQPKPDDFFRSIMRKFSIAVYSIGMISAS